MLIDHVHVAPGRVRLPDFDEGVGHRPAVLVDDAPGDDDALADRLARVLAREIGVVLA